jgi:Tol biopolymer transport system component/predicted Ser/Thr protein kinase
MTLTPGARVGGYEILSSLGAGGMGEVYRARDTRLNRDVAIKVLLAAVANDPDRLARFSREAQVLASLNHPNIAHIYGIEDAAIVMELVEGEDLAQRIARGPIPLDEALPIARQIAEALEAAHDHGIVHRDLKPANIKVRPDGTVKVLDFGLAKAVDPSAGSSVTAMNSPTLSIHGTQAGIILGTAAYMSPEQARGKSVDKRTDIWALGCVLFEMLTGKRAFPGDDATDTIVAVVSKEPDWSALPAAVPATIRKLLRRCLEKDPKQRIDSAAVARLEIDEARTSAPAAAAITMGRSRRVLPWAIAAALAVAVAWLAFTPSRPVTTAPLVRFGVPAPFGFTRPAGLSFTLSPDGQALAFAAVGAGGVTQIFTRRLDQPDAVAVAGSNNASQPFWSPDGRSLGFSKEDALYRSDLDGAAPRRLAAVPGGTPTNSFSTNAAWGANGVIVFAPRGAGLFRVPDTGGTPTPVTTLDVADGEYQHSSPWFLPDGRRVLFLSLSPGLRNVIWAVSIDDPARTRVTESSGGAQYVDGWLLTTTLAPRRLVAQRFDPDRLALDGTSQPVRDRLAFSTSTGPSGFAVSAAGTLVVDRPPPVIHQLVWMDREGRRLATTGPAAVIEDFALAPDEARVAASITHVDSSTSDIWLFDSKRPEGNRATFSGGTRSPLWAPDGRHLYYRNFPPLSFWLLAVGGTEPVRVESSGDVSNVRDITRDGRYLVFTSSPPRPEVWIQRVDLATEQRTLVQSQFGAPQARVSPDGRWLAFTMVLSGGPEVFVQPFDRPGERVQISRSGGFGAIWRADSRELYYEDGNALMAVTIGDQRDALEPGTPQPLFAVHTSGYATNQPFNIAAALNGQKFLVNTIVGDSDNAPLEVTLNWTAGLKE